MNASSCSKKLCRKKRLADIRRNRRHRAHFMRYITMTSWIRRLQAEKPRVPTLFLQTCLQKEYEESFILEKQDAESMKKKNPGECVRFEQNQSIFYSLRTFRCRMKYIFYCSNSGVAEKHRRLSKGGLEDHELLV